MGNLHDFQCIQIKVKRCPFCGEEPHGALVFRDGIDYDVHMTCHCGRIRARSDHTLYPVVKISLFGMLHLFDSCMKAWNR